METRLQPVNAVAKRDLYWVLAMRFEHRGSVTAKMNELFPNLTQAFLDSCEKAAKWDTIWQVETRPQPVSSFAKRDM